MGWFLYRKRVLFPYTYLEILENGEEGPHFAPESRLPENRELISEALLSVLIRLPGHSDWERWRAGFIELERYLNEEDWGLVEEFSNRAEEGPEAILAMDKERMQAANGVTRAVSRRKITRMEKLNESLTRANMEPER